MWQLARVLCILGITWVIPSSTLALQDWWKIIPLAHGGQCGKKGIVDILKAQAVLSRKLG